MQAGDGEADYQVLDRTGCRECTDPSLLAGIAANQARLRSRASRMLRTGDRDGAAPPSEIRELSMKTLWCTRRDAPCTAQHDEAAGSGGVEVAHDARDTVRGSANTTRPSCTNTRHAAKVSSCRTGPCTTASTSPKPGSTRSIGWPIQSPGADGGERRTGPSRTTTPSTSTTPSSTQRPSWPT